MSLREDLNTIYEDIIMEWYCEFDNKIWRGIFKPLIIKINHDTSLGSNANQLRFSPNKGSLNRIGFASISGFYRIHYSGRGSLTRVPPIVLYQYMQQYIKEKGL